MSAALPGDPGAITSLAEGQLFHLPNVYELDGRATTHPLDARGYATQNCYLLTEGDRALLIDTGFSVHEDSMVDRLASLLSPEARLSILLIRIGEYYGVCNVRPIATAFDVDRVYGKDAYDNPALATDFRPEYSPWRTPAGKGWAEHVDGVIFVGETTIEVAEQGERPLRAFPPPLRLLPTHWIYDAATKTLFTSDAFTHTWRTTPEGPWVIDDVSDSPSVSEVRDFMVGSRYWWLPGASTERIRERLREIFETLDIEIVAPGYGCVLRGKDVIAHHFQMVIEVLSATENEMPTGVTAGSRGN